MNYLEELAAQIKAKVPKSALPDSDVDELFLSYAVLALAKRDGVTAEDVHNAWVGWMTKHVPDHESLVPYDELDADTKAEDSPFVTAIHETLDRLS